MLTTPLCLALLVLAARASAAGPARDDVLLVTFFRGNGELGVYLAWSEDGLRFTPLNDDRPIMPPAGWPGQNLTRDPSVVFHRGRFHMVWTSNWSGRVFGYAESPDLVKWSKPVKVDPFPANLPEGQQPLNMWAPEIQWDPADRSFAVLWSTSTVERGAGNHRTYITRTRNGRTFTPAQLFLDQGFTAIDAQMVHDEGPGREKAGDRWVMVLKDERSVAEGGKNLRIATAAADLKAPWSRVSAPVAGPGSALRPHEMAEGPCLLRFRGEWLLYWDAFADGHYCLAASSDLEHWTDRTASLQMPPGARHGTVFVAPRSAVGWLGGS